MDQISVIIPAKNEERGLELILPDLTEKYPSAEVIVVDDGSTDRTVEVCRQHGVTAISHPYSIGNGAAIKTGARHATGDVLVFMDADSQHKPTDIEALLLKMDEGFDMVVGARSDSSQASFGRLLANRLYNRLASVVVGHEIKDLTSGFRAVRTNKFKEFLYLLPNGFSYPTTSTMAFFRNGYSVAYHPIHANQRVGKSHINPLREGVRFLLIIIKVATLYSPLKIFAPAAFLNFALGVGLYSYTYFVEGRFTNMSLLLFMGAILIFIFGLLAEQITTLMYKNKE
ncbi:MAG: glycosyltransferase family 2 protein [Pseudomonadales bacterium]|nr:glycosyltransferase family 2 protein [Pseudomonadales bacterium]